MAKRLTDTDIWRKPWFRKAPLKIKLLFNFLKDNCDHAGFLDVDYGLMSFMIGEEIEKEDLEQLSFLYVWIEPDKIFIQSFIEFQYKVGTLEDLNSDNNAHRGVISQLVKYKILGSNKGLTRPCLGAMDKDKEKDLDKDKDSSYKSEFKFSDFWFRYPKKVGKHRAETLWKKLSGKDRDLAVSKIDAYMVSLSDPKFTQQGDTYLSKRTFEDEFLPVQSQGQKSELERFMDGDHLNEGGQSGHLAIGQS